MDVPTPAGASGGTHKHPRSPLLSDDSEGLGSEDQRRSQIVGLEEEQGRFPLPEVDIPPGYESDDDIPLKESGNWSAEGAPHDPFLRSETQLNSNLKTGYESDHDSRKIERGESLEEFEKVEEEVMRQIEEEQQAANVGKRVQNDEEDELDLSGSDAEDEDAAPSFQNRQSVTDIKYTNPTFEMSVEEDEDVDSLGLVPEPPPNGPPPAYTPDREPEPSPMKQRGVGALGGGIGLGLMGAVGEMGGLAASTALGVGFGGIHQSNHSRRSSASQQRSREQSYDDHGGGYNKGTSSTNTRKVLFPPLSSKSSSSATLTNSSPWTSTSTLSFTRSWSTISRPSATRIPLSRSHARMGSTTT
ncbi:hypothetical protein L596_016133 [Steinernema carpocapsae]|uniref:Uncharacterized protein n=1 Tax=Steinernema carpocapsae TaxID=34508 RepID=A0A4U5NI26_STECR|nr:hypothetical protein L596_016133 [Steinernema carpocapsae]